MDVNVENAAGTQKTKNNPTRTACPAYCSPVFTPLGQSLFNNAMNKSKSLSRPMRAILENRRVPQFRASARSSL